MKPSGRGAKALFYVIVTPVAVAARPLWKRRLGLGADRKAHTYWRKHRRVVDAKDMKSQR
jgi:hypothetical protein